MDVCPSCGGDIAEVNKKARAAAGKPIWRKGRFSRLHRPTLPEHYVLGGAIGAHRIVKGVLAHLDVTNLRDPDHLGRSPVLDDDAPPGIQRVRGAGGIGCDEGTTEEQLEGVPTYRLYEKPGGRHLVAVNGKLLKIGAEDNGDSGTSEPQRLRELHP